MTLFLPGNQLLGCLEAECFLAWNSWPLGLFVLRPPLLCQTGNQFWPSAASYNTGQGVGCSKTSCSHLLPPYLRCWVECYILIFALQVFSLALVSLFHLLLFFTFEIKMFAPCLFILDVFKFLFWFLHWHMAKSLPRISVEALNLT